MKVVSSDRNQANNLISKITFSSCGNSVLSLYIVIRTYSLETYSLNRNLYVMLKFTEQPKTPGMTSKKNIAFQKRIS